jgi:hypothetical protein
MGSLAARTAFIAVAFLARSCSRPAPPPPPAPVGGDYGPVAAEQLRGRHSVVATGTSGARFVWEFTDDRFKVTGDGGTIPDDAVVTFLGGRQRAGLIEGRWALADRELTLSGITADGKAGYPDVTLRPFLTPVLRVDLAGTQYVFR